MEDIGCGLTWRGMDSAMQHCPGHTTCRWQPQFNQPQLNPYRLGRRPEQGPRLRCWPPGRRWIVCDWWTKIATCQKQHHYRHLGRKISESSRKSWRTNTRNEKMPLEHPWTLWSTQEKLWWSIYPRRRVCVHVCACARVYVLSVYVCFEGECCNFAIDLFIYFFALVK